MARRMLGTAGLSIVLSVLLVSCSPRQTIWVDVASEIVFEGERYQGVAGERFVIDREAIVEAGTSDPGASGTLPTVYTFPGISSSKALVGFTPKGEPVVFIAAVVMSSLPPPSREGSDPLSVAIPELCRYWRPPKPSECGGS